MNLKLQYASYMSKYLACIIIKQFQYLVHINNFKLMHFRDNSFSTLVYSTYIRSILNQTILKLSSQSCSFRLGTITISTTNFLALTQLSYWRSFYFYAFENSKIACLVKKHSRFVTLKRCDCVRVLRFFDGFEMLHILFTNFSRACQMLYWNWYNAIELKHFKFNHNFAEISAPNKLRFNRWWHMDLIWTDVHLHHDQWLELTPPFWSNSKVIFQAQS